jgi:hypothetical protein
VACHRIPGRFVQPLWHLPRGNASRNGWCLHVQVGSRRLHRIFCEIDADLQWWRQAGSGLCHCVEPAIVAKSQHRANSPDLDVALQRADLPVAELAGIALLQFIEH